MYSILCNFRNAATSHKFLQFAPAFAQPTWRRRFATKENAEDFAVPVRNIDAEVDVWGLGAPHKPPPKTMKEVEERVMAALYRVDKRGDYKFTLTATDLHWDMGVHICDIPTVLNELEKEFPDVHFHNAVFYDTRKPLAYVQYICDELRISTARKTIRQKKIEQRAAAEAERKQREAEEAAKSAKKED